LWANLTERDVEVILDIYKYRYLKAEQIKALHFPSIQTARRRLRALVRGGYVKYFTVPGISEYIYHLDKKGAEVTASELGVDLKDLRWSRKLKEPKDYYFMRHFLKINDFRIILTSACRFSDIDLLGFIPDYYGEKTERGGTAKYIRDFVLDIKDRSRVISHTPDGVFALEKDGKSALFFLEIDRGTETLTNEEKGFLKSISFYLNYLVDEKYQRYQNDFKCGPFKAFRALVVTTSEERLNNMRSASSALSFPYPQAKRFIWFTTFDRLKPETIFGPIWRSADIRDKNLYKIG